MITVDGTYKICKNLKIDCMKPEISLLSILDDMDNSLQLQLLNKKKESHNQLIPYIINLRLKMLLYGSKQKIISNKFIIGTGLFLLYIYCFYYMFKHKNVNKQKRQP